MLSQDIFVKKSLKRIREVTSEKELWVGGSFVSEKHMKEVLKLSEKLTWIILCFIYVMHGLLHVLYKFTW